MTKNDLNNLLFLFGTSAALSMACDLGSTEDSGQGGTGATGTGADDGSNTSGVGTTGGGGASTGNVDAGSDGGTAGSTGGGAYNKACLSYADNVSMCYPDGMYGYDGYAKLCQGYIDYYYADTPDCSTAWEELFACLSMLSCDDLAKDAGCEDQAAAIATACPKTGGTGSSSGGAGSSGGSGGSGGGGSSSGG